MPENKSEVNSKTLDCFCNSIKDNFVSFCGVEPTLEKEVVQNNESDIVIGSISIIGKENAWSLMLGLPRETITPLALKFTGFEIDFDSADMGDMVGELANIIAGDLVAKLCNIGINANMSLPMVSRGKGIQILKVNDLEYTQFLYSIPFGNFWVLIVNGHTKIQQEK